jgi:hypothetical protein
VFEQVDPILQELAPPFEHLVAGVREFLSGFANLVSLFGENPSISGAILCWENRFASSTVSSASIAGPSASWMIYPSMFSSTSEPPICAGFMYTTRECGDDGLRQSMISRRNGVRDVRRRPGSPADTRERPRY